jgi:single-strand DNA-binding protein
MADGLNQATLFGNLGADPELRVTPSGTSVLKLRMATTESYLDRNNARQERTEWHSITVWGKRADALAKIVTKGDKILIQGRIRTSTYEKNGEKRYRTEIHAEQIFLAGGRRPQQPATGPQQLPQQKAPPPEAQPGDQQWTEFQGGDDIPF